MPPAGPLSGLRVVELSSFVATPLCGLTLAQLGAEVIRVEPMGGGPDRTRWPLAPNGTSLYWNGLNPGKRAIEVNLGDPRGRQVVADLVAEEGEGGGILVTNTERWPELSFEALSTRRPDVVHVVLAGTHDGGIAVDYTVQAGTGFPHVTGPAEHAGPVNNVVPAWDFAAGLYLATGLLSAELRRRATGQGSQVRVVLEDVALAAAGHLGYLADAQLGANPERTREGNFMYGGFGRDFTSSDGRRFMVVALTPRHWTELLQMTGLAETVAVLGRALGTDFSDEGERYRHRAVLAGLVAEWFSRHDGPAVESALARTRLLWSPYRTFAELAGDDARLLREQPIFSTIDQPGVGRLLAPGSPVMVDGHRGGPRPAPQVGQDTRTVLTDVLGVTEAELQELASSGVLRAPAPADIVA
ncbi:dehydratase [Intrasporangium chromatireducens Q5-1]|uniref:Dehydratase n=1 Tax=Intrasporangium chromatireducens Q5-1 TaxID=584657 RepID=W9GJJ9_9MICO|nr:CoA transferase [Intrasporangium chromatireducens]EWT06275.1 dehydratase [Intrasporangium chromatireducens Q5-1]